MLLGAGCLALLLISWFIGMHAKTIVDLQLELMEEAAKYAIDGVYIRAEPLLEEAAGYNTKYTLQAEAELKKVYLSLIDKRGYLRKYQALLDKQMSRKDANPEIFEEASLHYLSINSVPEALNTLKAGISKTGSETLISIYESNRYMFETGHEIYDDTAAIFESTVQVCTDGAWGIADSGGALIIPCMYEQISTFSNDCAIAKKGGEIFAIDSKNNRIAKLHEPAVSFGNYSMDRVPLLIGDFWYRANGEFTVGTAAFEYIGMYSDGYAAAKTDGKWGVIDLAYNWLVPAEYEGVIQDELGRCYCGGAVFVRDGISVRLLINGQPTGEAFEDARPFCGCGPGESYAAVMKDGLWGFIDAGANVVIDYQFDDALSFGQHLAAVKQDDMWGYISADGHIAIEPVYYEAKSFSNGSAPVLTSRGWQFITLLEYKASSSGLFS